MRISSKTSRQKFWRQVLSRQRKSGLSIHRFCEQEGLAAATFYIWKRRLGTPADGARAVAVVRGTTVCRASAPAGFAPVQVEPQAVSAAAVGALEIVLPHERRIRLTGKVDRQQLAEVLAALAD